MSVNQYRNIGFVILDPENFLLTDQLVGSRSFLSLTLYPVLVKPDEVLCSINLVAGGYLSYCESNANRIFDPEHVCNLAPGVRVLRWLQSARLPKYRAIFLEEPYEGAAAT